MRDVPARWLDEPRTVYIGSAASLALGLLFTFVWAPHPWGWQGIDQYHELARAVARGEPFGTTDVPWGYAYYVAALYATFGERAWLPVLGQVLLNASVPVLLYRLVRPATDQRTATLAALLIGLLSFNTIYASTQASDAICTVLFLWALVWFASGLRTGAIRSFAACGLLLGLVPQFRPNMVLFPFVLVSIYLVVRPWSATKAVRAGVLLAVVGLALAPWVVRNYRLTGALLPTSTHGGVQLWYGSLQVGPYLESRAHNPRSIFEWPAFDYTSLTGSSIIVTAEAGSSIAEPEATVALVYWTDRNSRPERLAPVAHDNGRLLFEVPAQAAPTALYFIFEASLPDTDGAAVSLQTTPLEGAANPFVFFVSTDHLADLDRHGDLFDVFDVVRLMRHLVWGEALLHAHRMDLDGDGVVDERDLAFGVNRVIPGGMAPNGVAPFGSLTGSADSATLHLADDSRLVVPRKFSGLVTDLHVEGRLAGALASAHKPLAALAAEPSHAPVDPGALVGEVRTNAIFYRRELHQMRRYTALALDNIRRDPGGFFAASVYRMVRMFIIRGTADQATTQQFDRSRWVYGAGTALSAGYLGLFVAGVVVAWRRRSPLLPLLVPILYVPLTICFVLTNMRYTITVQPLMFAFVALALVTLCRLDPPVRTAAQAARHR